MQDGQKPEFVGIVGERSRTYIFGGGQTLKISGVVALSAPPGRSHRIETESGEKYIVPPTFLAINIDADNWSV